MAALSVHRQPALKEWSPAEYDFIRLGPAYFSQSSSTPKEWDLSQIRTGVAALSIDYARKSELNYTAIDHDTLRVYRLRWYGSSLTTELDRIGYKPKQSDSE